MNTSELLKLDVDQAGELKAAFRREGPWTNEKIKMLCERKGFLYMVLAALEGHAEIKMIENLIDFDAKPFVPNGWTTLSYSEQLPNRVHGQMKFDPSRVKLYLAGGQKKGAISGHELRKKLTKEPVYGAQLLDFYLANPHHIPEGWKGKQVFFWGNIYRGAGGLCVLSLCQDGAGGWCRRYRCVDNGWLSNSPSVVFGE